MTNVYDPYPDAKYVAKVARDHKMKVADWRKSLDRAAAELDELMKRVGGELSEKYDGSYVVRLKYGEWHVDQLRYTSACITTRFKDAQDIEGLCVMQNGLLIRHKWNHHTASPAANVGKIRTMVETILEKEWLRK